MKNTISVLEGVRKFLAENINKYIDNNNPFLGVKVPELEDKNVMVDFPDIDSLPFKDTIYIIPDYFEINPQTTCSQLVDNNIKIYIFCKRDKHDNLIRRSSTYFNALCQCVIRDTTLGGTVNLAQLGSCDYYPSVTAENTISAYEINLDLKYIFQV